MSVLLPLVDVWYFADLPGSQGARADDLRRALLTLDPRAVVTCHASVEAALDAAEAGIQADGRADGMTGRIVVTGSFITVGAAIARREAALA